AERTGSFEETDVAGVDEIVAAIGEDHLLGFSLPLVADFGQLGAGVELGHGYECSGFISKVRLVQPAELQPQAGPLGASIEPALHRFRGLHVRTYAEQTAAVAVAEDDGCDVAFGKRMIRCAQNTLPRPKMVCSCATLPT